MRIQIITRVTIILMGILGLIASGCADESEKLVKKAVERSTLNQAGTKPFHFKAVLAPSFERDRGSNRTGEVEMWWASPTQWRREVRSPEFHQIAIVNGGREWQRNEGEYFPEWLRETSMALIEPVPSLDEVLKQVKDAEVRRLMGNTYFSWTMMSTDGKVEKGMGAGPADTKKKYCLDQANQAGLEELLPGITRGQYVSTAAKIGKERGIHLALDAAAASSILKRGIRTRFGVPMSISEKVFEGAAILALLFSGEEALRAVQNEYQACMKY